MLVGYARVSTRDQTHAVDLHPNLTRGACGQKLGLSEEIVHVHIRRQDASG